MLIFTLQVRCVAVTDFGVRKGFALTYGWKDMPKPKELLSFGEKWRPYRTTASWYFWRALDVKTPD
jgi:3-methyladenine DNA glycosylase/8-oxoguanine DNA glycosylase